MDIIEGVHITQLKVIPNAKGDVMHALKTSEIDFIDFGEAYFSRILKGEIKGWKKHTRMTLNIVVPVGEVRFVLFDDRSNSATYSKFFEVCLGSEKYQRLTIPPMIWMAFQGIDTGLNMLLNIASIEHDPAEAEARNLEDIDFNWKA